LLKQKLVRVLGSGAAYPLDLHPQPEFADVMTYYALC